MGIVYEAEDDTLDRRVAIKVIRPDAGGSRSRERERLLEEARALARLSHPNVISIYEVGEHGDEIFIAMEFRPRLHAAAVVEDGAYAGADRGPVRGGGARAGGGPRGRAGAPRLQARQRAGRRGRPRADRRLRPGSRAAGALAAGGGDLGARLDVDQRGAGAGDRVAGRDAGLHVARAGARPGLRRAQRSVLVLRRAARGAVRAPAVSQGRRGGAGPPRRAAAAEQRRARAGAGLAATGADARAGVRAGGPLRQHGRAAGGAGAWVAVADAVVAGGCDGVGGGGGCGRGAAHAGRRGDVPERERGVVRDLGPGAARGGGAGVSGDAGDGVAGGRRGGVVPAGAADRPLRAGVVGGQPRDLRAGPAPRRRERAVAVRAAPVPRGAASGSGGGGPADRTPRSGGGRGGARAGARPAADRRL
jgi:hypothetical protein